PVEPDIMVRHEPAGAIAEHPSPARAVEVVGQCEAKWSRHGFDRSPRFKPRKGNTAAFFARVFNEADNTLIIHPFVRYSRNKSRQKMCFVAMAAADGQETSRRSFGGIMPDAEK